MTMNQTPAQRTIIFGTSLATILVLAILVFTGGGKPTPAPIPAPAGEAALPMLEGVNTTNQPVQVNQTPVQAESKPDSQAPPTR